MALNLQVHPQNYTVKPIALLFCLFLIASSTVAQKPEMETGEGSISGRIVDSATGKPIAFATVALYRTSDNKIVNGASADENGKFTIEQVAPGQYRAIFDFIGYNKYTRDSIVLSFKSKKITLGDILLGEKQKILNTVTITGKTSIIENQADKIVFNVSRDVTSQGGVATDVLKKIPQVSVDLDGNVEVQGNGNVQFLIDGKPSTIFGNNLNDVLQSIPASQIEKIEVITSPGARYDSEGTGGIINIVLKKNDVRGINASINASIGTRLENGSFNINARRGKFGIHAYISGSTNIRSDVISTMDRTTTDTAAEHLKQSGKSGFVRHGFQSGGGIDWSITPKDNITLNVSYNGFGYDGSGKTAQNIYSQNAAGNVLTNVFSQLNNSSLYASNVMDYSATYKKQFDRENQELNVLFNSSTSKYSSDYSQTQNSRNNDTIYSGTRGNNPGVNKETDFSMDYSQPFNDNFSLETGIKGIFTNINSATSVYVLNIQSNDYIFNSFQSDGLTYNRNIYAAYVSASFNLFDFIHGKAGLRYEHTTTAANFGINDSSINIPDYNTFSPSLVLTRDIGHGQSLKLSYNHRIERPDYRKLNPSINATDPKNITTGNPELQPEIGDKFEAGYNKTFNKGGNLNASLFYQTSNQDVKPYVTYYPKFLIGDSFYTNVALTNYANIGLEQKTGLSVSGSVPVTSKLNVRGNIQVYDRRITNTYVAGENSDGIDYRINLNITYMFDSTLTAEAFGNFNSPVTTVQGKTPSWSSYSFAIRKELFHKKGSIGFTTTLPFSKYVIMNTAISGQNFVLNSTREIPLRSFGITFQYRFGKMEFKKPGKDDENNEGGGMGE
jgi:ferric enterobactin receptor